MGDLGRGDPEGSLPLAVGEREPHRHAARGEGGRLPPADRVLAGEAREHALQGGGGGRDRERSRDMIELST